MSFNFKSLMRGFLCAPLFIIFSSICISCPSVCTAEWSPNVIDLPDSHLTRYLNSFDDEADKCRNSAACNYKNILDTKLCWGYEQDDSCPNHLGKLYSFYYKVLQLFYVIFNNNFLIAGYSNAHCPDHHRGWSDSKSQQQQTFFDQADFGFVKQQRESKATICKSSNPVSFHYIIL